MKTQGWVKIHRQLLQNELWTRKPYSYGQAWIDLLLNASHEKFSLVFHNMKIDLLPGDIVTNQQNLSSRFGWKRQMCRTFLLTISATNMATITTTPKYTRISINNWSKYQGTNQQKARSATKGQPTLTYIYNKNEKEDKKEFYSIEENSEGYQKYLQARNSLLKSVKMPMVRGVL